MALALVPHAADAAGRLHVWVGLADVNPAPAPSFRVNGAPVVPTTLRPLTPVLTGALGARADTTVFTGFFELRDLPPGLPVTLEVTAGTERIERRVATLPARVPDGPQDRFNVLLLSCFHQLEDKTGTAGAVLSRLKVTPHLTLFGGDQVYLDLPTAADFKDDAAWLGNKFQNDYLANWFGDRRSGDPRTVPPGYPQVLSLAPGVFMPDDHEYWNNYPFKATVIQNSWSEGGRRRWTQAAEAVYRAFQEHPALGLGAPRAIDVEPLSMLMLDTRSQRALDSRARAGDLLGAPGRKALADWVDRLVAHAGDARPWFGMLVTGQSFFSPAAGPARGAIADYEYPDYAADYAYMVEQVERVTRAGLPVILATGDVHWGRMLRADDPAAPGATVFEVISSPTSLVSSILVDQAKETWGAIKDLFGPSDPWPRHGEPAKPPERFGRAGQYSPTLVQRTTGKPAAMRGNQAFMLRFARSASGLDVEVTCYPLSGNAAFDGPEQWSATLQLRPPRGV
jgi:PhoD-like phosphatase